MKRYRTKYQTGGNADPLASQKSFFSAYLQSPKYLERLKKQGYVNPSQIIKDRLARMKATTFTDVTGTGLGSEYKKDNNAIYYDNAETLKHGMTKLGVKTHEMAHAAGAMNVFAGRSYNDPIGLNDADIKAIDARNKLAGRIMDDDPNISHDSRAAEFKADMDTLRYYMKKDNIYDAGTQDFNADFLKKAKEKYGKDKNINRLFERASDKDLIWLMNNIAMQQQQPDNMVMAQMGGIKSMLGYSRNSPYKNDPFIDIFTPGGLIDMSNTDMDLIGIDNKGNKKKMKAGRKNPYKFEGDIVREIPVKSGNPYQQGGMTPEQVFNFLFEGDDQEEQRMQQEEAAANLATREAEIKKKEKTYNEQLIDLARQRRQVEDDADYNEAMAIAYGMFGDEELPAIGTSNNSGKAIPTINRPLGPSAGKGVNPSVLRTEKDIFSEFEGITNLGIWGDKSHQQRVSDHNTGDAQDFGIGTDIDKGNKIAQKLIAEAGNRKVKYIIFNGKIWNPSISNEWRPYRGKNPHSTHVHVSYHR